MPTFHWIRYENLSNRALDALLQSNNIELICGRDSGYGSHEGEILVTGDLALTDLRQLVWNENGGAFCEVVEADYDAIEHLL